MSSTSVPHFVIGVDIGGTFTDCVVLSGDGEIHLGKVPSTPPDFHEGFVHSLGGAATRMGITLGDLLRNARSVYHGCTVGTNALVERRSSTVGVLTTAGHRDSLFLMQGGGRLIGADARSVAHVASQTKPAPLVPKRLVEEVDERIAFDGSVVVELNEDRCREAIARLLDGGAEAFAVSLLWSIANTSHERRVAELIREAAPAAFITVSSDVVPRPGEYQRTVATVINALVGPVTSSYLLTLEGKLKELGYDGTLHIMSCTGGLVDSGSARLLPLLTIGSGPVAGLIGAGHLARHSGAEGATTTKSVDVITGDMGGTTFDVGVIRRGEPVTRSTSRHGQYEYFVRTLDVRSIGAGGGSIIHFDDETGSLRVGPRSAGAAPGPACYLRGGTEATITDADLVLGYLNPQYFLGGDLALGVDAAREALGRAGAPLGFSPEKTAGAAARIVDHQMADAIRLASIQQGYDARACVLYAYGGAGAVHCPAVARQLHIPTVVVPLGDLASTWSAFGVASSDAVVVKEAPVMFRVPFDVKQMNPIWESLEANVLAQFARQGIQRSAVVVARSIDMRYSMQINEVRVSAPDGVWDAAVAAELIRSFEEEYERLYGQGTGYADAGFTLTALRIEASAHISNFRLQPLTIQRGERQDLPEPVRRRDVIWYEDGTSPRATDVFDGTTLRAGDELEGPAIVEFRDTTLVLRHKQTASVDAFGSVVITV